MTTIVAAILLMGVVVLLLGIGWLLTGKSRLRKGGCGSFPSKNKKGDSSCSTCGSKRSCEEDDEQQGEHDDKR